MAGRSKIEANWGGEAGKRLADNGIFRNFKIRQSQVSFS